MDASDFTARLAIRNLNKKALTGSYIKINTQFRKILNYRIGSLIGGGVVYSGRTLLECSVYALTDLGCGHNHSLWNELIRKV